jgi:beta-lactamase regulating signal transducer with metallopeptidase domain
MRQRSTTLIIALAVLLCTLSLSAFAQTSNSANSSQTTTTQQTTRTAETTQPTTVQVTRTQSTGINPLWLGLGAVLLLAIVAIAAMGARGRSRDHTAVVTERETVVRRE